MVDTIILVLGNENVKISYKIALYPHCFAASFTVYL